MKLSPETSSIRKIQDKDFSKEQIEKDMERYYGHRKSYPTSELIAFWAMLGLILFILGLAVFN